MMKKKERIMRRKYRRSWRVKKSNKSDNDGNKEN